MPICNINKVLSDLAKIRPVFHSEADFQHAIAWQIHHEWPECSMRLEFKPPGFNDRMYLDIWASDREEKLAIELKYKTRGSSTQFNGESFNLLDQSAQDLGRYDFFKDISRLEQVASKSKATGYAIFLTNDSAYWKQPLNSETVDAGFRIHHGRTLLGKASWGTGASAGTTRGREQEIQLNGKYVLYWQRYSSPSSSPYGDFKYLLVNVQ